MREILFRGKRLNNGEWIVGHLLRYFGGRARIVETGENIFSYEMDDSIIQTVAHHVIPSTVGQYTGLCDKNGKKIFEGDIVRHHNDSPYFTTEKEEKGVVFWDDQYCGWRRTSNGEFHGGVVKDYRMSKTCDYEIIGNIHDNPELLEVSHE